MAEKKFPVIMPETKGLWTKPPQNDPPTVPPGMMEVVVLADSFPRFVVEITVPTWIGGQPALPGERFEIYGDDARMLLAMQKAILIEEIPAASTSRVRRLPKSGEVPQTRPDEPPFVKKL